MSETISSAKELVRIYWKANIPTYVHGKPGVGKSELFAQLAAEANVGFIDNRLAQMDPVDLLGLPTVHEGKSTWARPAYWPDEERDGPKGIMLLDELSDCTKAVQSAAYQLILNHKVGPHILPAGWYVCAAGNRREDGAAAQAMSTALGNRFAHIDVEPNAEDFIQWCNKNSIHYLIPGYIHFRPAHLHTMEGGDKRAFASPRSWARASLVCDAPASQRFRLMRGLVGEGVAGEFETYMKTMDLPDFEDIIKDPKKCRIPAEPSSKYALSSMLARYLKRDNIDKVLTYVSREQFGRDFSICTILDGTRRDPGLCDTSSFVEFCNANSDLHL